MENHNIERHTIVHEKRYTVHQKGEQYTATLNLKP